MTRGSFSKGSRSSRRRTLRPLSPATWQALGLTIVFVLLTIVLLMSGCASPSVILPPDGSCGHRHKFVPSAGWGERLTPDEKRQVIEINEDINRDCGVK